MSVLSRRVLSLGLVVPMLLMAKRLAGADEEEAAAAQPAYNLDVGDLWRMLRHKDEAPEDEGRKFVVFAPTIGSKPSTGLNGGVPGNVAFFLGDPDTTRISSLSSSLRISRKKQTLGAVRFSTFTGSDRWFFQGDERLQWTSLDIYGHGGNTWRAMPRM